MLNDFEIQSELMIRPMTRKIFLGQSNYDDKTEIVKISKRLSRLHNSKYIGYSKLYGFNRGENIYYSLNKKYFIILYKDYDNTYCYYCNNIYDKNFGEILIKQGYINTGFSWKRIKDKILHRSRVLSCF